jgi:uncharacterized membrane protein YfcA
LLDFLFATLAGILAGMAGSLGLGGGGVLLLYLTIFAGVPQIKAQGVNLIFFIPCAVIAVIKHLKSGLIEKKLVLEFALIGLLGAVGGFLAANLMGGELLQKIFGGFLILIGITAFKKKKPEAKKG